MKILVTDFDYTFFTLEYKQNIEAVQQFVNEGNIFIIATGRNLKQVLSDMQNLYVPYFFLICNDGAVIYNRKNELIYEKEIPSTTAESVFHKLDKSKIFQEVYIDTGEEYTVSTDAKAIKIIAKPQNFEKAEKRLQRILIEYKEIEGYLSENWVNITSSEASKGNGIEIILNKFHFDPNDVYVVGDGINDISMIQKYKGYAVASADSEVQKQAIKTIQSFKDILTIIKQEEQA